MAYVRDLKVGDTIQKIGLYVREAWRRYSSEDEKYADREYENSWSFQSWKGNDKYRKEIVVKFVNQPEYELEEDDYIWIESVEEGDVKVISGKKGKRVIEVQPSADVTVNKKKDKNKNKKKSRKTRTSSKSSKKSSKNTNKTSKTRKTKRVKTDSSKGEIFRGIISVLNTNEEMVIQRKIKIAVEFTKVIHGVLNGKNTLEDIDEVCSKYQMDEVPF